MGHLAIVAPFFTGRGDELRKLRTNLLTEKVAVIKGQTGFGKTQIAAKYVQEYQKEYSRIFLGNAETEEKLAGSYHEFAKGVRIPLKKGPDEERPINDIIQDFKYWLQENDKWLLVLDDVQDLQKVREQFPLINEQSHLLLITQKKDTGSVVREPITAGPIGEDKGVLFLLQRAGMLSPEQGLEDISSTSDRQAALDLYKEVDGCFLVLNIFGKTIAESGSTLPEIFKEYKKHTVKYLHKESDNYPSKTVAKAFDFIFKKLNEKYPDVLSFLNFCSFLDHEAIPEQFIKKALKSIEGEIIVFKDFNLGDTIAILNTFSLIERDSKNRAFSFHRLSQVTRRYAMDESKQEFWERKTIQAISRTFPDITRGRDYCQLCFPHAQACIQLIEQRKKKELLKNTPSISRPKRFLWRIFGGLNKTSPARENSEEIINDKDIAQLYYRVAQYLQEIGLLTQAETLLLRSYDITKNLEIDAKINAVKLYRLGTIRRALGKLDKAMEQFQQAEAIFNNFPVPNKKRISDCLMGRASIYQNQGKDREAELLYTDALQMREKQYGVETVESARVHSSLAGSCRSKGDLEKAEEHIKKALTVFRKVDKKEYESRDLPRALNILSEIRRDEGKYGEAELICKESLNLFEQRFGENDHETAQCRTRLARFYVDRQEYEIAEKWCIDALKTLQGNDHPSNIYILGTLARIYRKQNLDKAEEYLNRALSIAENKYGEHPQTAECLVNLASYLSEKSTKIINEAEKNKTSEWTIKLYKRAIQIHRKTVGINSIKVAYVYNQLGRHYRNCGFYLKANSLFQYALKIYKHKYGEYNINTAYTHNQLGWNYDLQNNPELAQPHYEQALDIYIQISGIAHHKTFDIANALINNLLQQRKVPELDNLIQYITTLIVQNTEKQTESLAEFLSRLAKNCYFEHKYEEAELLHKRALMIYLQVLATNHPYTPEALHCLEELDETKLTRQEALETFLQQLGAKHPQITNILFYLANDYDNAVRPELAIWYYFRVAFILRYELSQENKMLKNSFKSLAFNYLKLGDKETAISFFEEFDKVDIE